MRQRSQLPRAFQLVLTCSRLKQTNVGLRAGYFHCGPLYLPRSRYGTYVCLIVFGAVTGCKLTAYLSALLQPTVSSVDSSRKSKAVSHRYQDIVALKTVGDSLHARAWVLAHSFRLARWSDSCGSALCTGQDRRDEVAIGAGSESIPTVTYCTVLQCAPVHSCCYAYCNLIYVLGCSKPRRDLGSGMSSCSCMHLTLS